jgi:SAM-dependent methyltransferase
MNEQAAMADEFDVEARWTLEAVRSLGADHAIPAACRGSASPAGLAWLAGTGGLAAGDRLVDVGAGMGGPAAFAAEHAGVSPILLEPMLGACRTAWALFGLPTIASAGERLPLADESVDAAWCLGVLCTTDAKATILAEGRRVLRPGGHLGLLAFTAPQERPPGAPEGNTFPSEEGLHALLAAADLVVADQIDVADLPAASEGWTRQIEAVERAVLDRHGDDPRSATARDQQRRMGRLLAAGTVTGRFLVARASGKTRRAATLFA